MWSRGRAAGRVLPQGRQLGLSTLRNVSQEGDEDGDGDRSPPCQPLPFIILTFIQPFAALIKPDAALTYPLFSYRSAHGVGALGQRGSQPGGDTGRGPERDVQVPGGCQAAGYQLLLVQECK